MTNKTDLYYVHIFNDFSGSPRVLRDAIDCNIADLNSTYVFTSKHSGFLDNIAAKRVNCFYARSDNRYIQLFYFLISQMVMFVKLFFYLFIGFFKGRKSTVVINTMLPFGAGLASKIIGANVVYYVHESYIKPLFFKQCLRFVIEHCATHVIFVSAYLKAEEGFKNPKQSIIYNGLRSDFMQVNKVDVNLKYSGKKIFFCGSLKLYKGVEQLLLLAELLPDFKVIAAINCEAYELKGFVSKRIVPDNLKFVVRPLNIQSYFASSFLVVNLSLPEYVVETFGLSLLEGMAFGTPVISPPVGGPTEFVNKKNGLLIDSREMEGIVKFIRNLDASVDNWRLFSEQALLTASSFTALEYRKSFKCFFENNKLI